MLFWRASRSPNRSDERSSGEGERECSCSQEARDTCSEEQCLVFFFVVAGPVVLYSLPMPKITIYSTPWCGYCKQAKEYFQTKGWEFTEKDVQADTVAREEMINKTGQLGVPVIDVNGKIIIGFDRPKIDQYAAS